MVATTLGGRIEQARTAAGYTPRQLALRLGVKEATVENWEKDRSEPRSNKLLTLAGVLNVPVLWLLTGEGETGASDPAAFSETRAISQKLERALVLQSEASALLTEISADVARLQRQLDAEQDLAA